MRMAPTTARPRHLEHRWLILAVLFTARAVIAFQFQSLAAVGPVLVQDLGIDYSTLGTLVGLYMLPGVVVALPGGILGQRFGDKRLVIIGLALMAAGGAWVAMGGSAASLAAGRILCGTGAALLNILLAKMVTDWFAPPDIVLAMALFVSSWPVGIGLALIVLPSTTNAAGTAVALGSTALVSGLALLLVALVYRHPAGHVPAPPNFRIALSSREWCLCILSGLVWALYNVGFIVVLVFGPSLLTAEGMPLEAAGATVSLVTWTVLLSLPLGGYLAQRANSPDRVIVGCFVVMALIACLLPTGVSPLLVCVALGLAAGPPAGLIMGLPGSALQPANRSAGMGVYYTCYYAAMAGIVPVAGLIRDGTGSAASPMYFAAASLMAAGVSLALFRLVERRSARAPSPVV